MKNIFITATDTDAGKTFVSCALVHALTNLVPNTVTNTLATKSLKVAAFKPISAGCELVAGELINEDAKLLSQFANSNQSITDINPIAFAEPIAPHIAAKKQNRPISVAEINDHYQQVITLNADITLVEGAGGWRLPLGPLASQATESPSQQFLSDFVKANNLEVILIVNMKLGCLNHALLTYQAIKADGLECIGWIANCAAGEVMNNLSENIVELTQLLPIPNIAQLDFIDDVDEQGNVVTFADKINVAANNIDLSVLGY